MIGPAGLEPLEGARNRKKYTLKLFSIIPDLALNREMHLIRFLKFRHGGSDSYAAVFKTLYI